MVPPHEEGPAAGNIGPSWEGSVRKVAQRTILVADDDASIRSLLKQLLSDEGYSVVEATTGNEVVEKVKDTNPDLVIMDVRMPELDGIEALSKLKATSPKTSVLIMTAFGTSNHAIRAMELGAFDYITKPFELDKIALAVKRVLEYRDLTSEVQVLRAEIAEMSRTMQTKLLGVLQDRKIERVGSSLPIKVDIRIVCATNKDLQKQVEQNKFRDDLFYRLNVINIKMPPLRERKEDIPALVEHFLAKHRYSATAQPAAISEEALKRLMEYDWPGNVRELENVVERAVVLSRGQIITSRELPFGDHEAGEHEEEGGDEVSVEKSFFKKSVAQFEKDLIMKALRDANGNRSKAAEMLGIYRRLLYAKIKEYGLEGYPPKGRAA